MRISLLRSPVCPTRGGSGRAPLRLQHPAHAGRWDETTVAQAYALNDPALAMRTEQARTPPAATTSLLSVDSPNIVIETVKRAEDGNGLIVRLYESAAHARTNS